MEPRTGDGRAPGQNDRGRGAGEGREAVERTAGSGGKDAEGKEDAQVIKPTLRASGKF